MMSAAELVQATSSTNAEQHWIGAAAYAAMGAYSEPDEEDSDGGKLTTGPVQPSVLEFQVHLNSCRIC
jgi:hypothetical protein